MLVTLRCVHCGGNTPHNIYVLKEVRYALCTKCGTRREVVIYLKFVKDDARQG